MNCDPEKIYLYLDGELSEAEDAQVEEHLHECAACADLSQSQQALLVDLDGLAEVATPVWLERAIIERTYDDLSATFQHRSERRQALRIVGVLSLTTAAFVRFDVVADFLLALLTGFRAVGSVVWKIASVFLKGISFVTVGLVHGFADDGRVTLLPAVLMAVILSLVLVRLMIQLNISTDKQ